jgi:FkbH-like protein
LSRFDLYLVTATYILGGGGAGSKRLLEMAENIRLVVWDLDETLWRGTLTEGGIQEHVEVHYEIVRELARRGIMSSICSKNDFDAVKKILQERGIWDYFIFPSIDWLSKGPRLMEIVEQVQLRPETVLFIDDNPSNRGEALELVAGLQVWDETRIGEILTSSLFKGKDDSCLSRLAQYKLLEQKGRERQTFQSDFSGFLRGSDIVVEIDYDIEPYMARAVELINRTNQLNFTKRRLPDDLAEAEQELWRQVNASYGRRAGVVKVKDRFGDYGVVGFYLMDGVWGHTYLLHFAFSCRTISMGVEQWVYHRLGKPHLDIVGEVVARLDFDPDWINAKDRAGTDREMELSAIRSARLRGGCELEVIKHFFGFEARHLHSELVYARGIQTVWNSHTATLFLSDTVETRAGEEALAMIGFVPGDFRPRFLDNCDEHTLLVLSNSFDPFATLYKHKELGFVVPIFFFGTQQVTGLSEAQLNDFFDRVKYNDEQKEKFLAISRELVENYTLIENSADYLARVYEQLIRSVPNKALLIFLLAPTYAPRASGVVDLKEQIEINARIRKVAQGRCNVRIVDMANSVTSVSKMHNFSNLHFDRECYRQIYLDIAKTYSNWLRDGE